MRRLCTRAFARAPGVNELYVPDVRPTRPALQPRAAPDVTTMDGVDARHWAKDEWSPEEVRDAAEEHCIFTWGASKPSLAWAPTIVRGEGIYLYDDAGREYIDWTSQAVCANLGHTVPPAVRDAVAKQLETIPFVYGGLGISPVRAKLAKLLAEICPGDINGFLFPSSGGEANEAAVRAARRFTGRQKILSRYRSYHGGSASTLTMTGDPRRWMAETNVGGFVHMLDPNPFSFAWGDDESSVVDRSLAAMEEQIMYEGPQTIAAVFLESIPGSGGVLIPPAGYLQGVRALCDKYDILLVLDEVMLGFGRTGKMFGFQNFDGVVPDIVTFAKGISGAYLPLSGVGMRQEIKEFFAECVPPRRPPSSRVAIRSRAILSSSPAHLEGRPGGGRAAPCPRHRQRARPSPALACGGVQCACCPMARRLRNTPPRSPRPLVTHLPLHSPPRPSALPRARRLPRGPNAHAASRWDGARHTTPTPPRWRAATRC